MTNMDKNITVILADDHRTILQSISYLLELSPEIEVLGTAENGEEAVALYRDAHPDVIILDIDMPKLNGLQAAARLRAMNGDIKILMFSIYDEPSIVRAAFKQGASGYVLKSRAATDLIKAVKSVSEGEKFVSAPVAGYVSSNLM